MGERFKRVSLPEDLSEFLNPGCPVVNSSVLEVSLDLVVAVFCVGLKI